MVEQQEEAASTSSPVAHTSAPEPPPTPTPSAHGTAAQATETTTGAQTSIISSPPGRSFPDGGSSMRAANVMAFGSPLDR